MKTSEFIQQAEALGITVKEHTYDYVVYHDEMYIGKVSNRYPYDLSIMNTLVDESITEKLEDIMYQYSKTPIEERD